MRPPGLIACAYSWPIAWVRPGKLSRSRARDWSRLPDSNRRIKGFTALCPTTELRRHRSGIAAGGLEPYPHDRLPRLLVPCGVRERIKIKWCSHVRPKSPCPCAFRQYHYSTAKAGFGGRVSSPEFFNFFVFSIKFSIPGLTTTHLLRSYLFSFSIYRPVLKILSLVSLSPVSRCPAEMQLAASRRAFV